MAGRGFGIADLDPERRATPVGQWGGKRRDRDRANPFCRRREPNLRPIRRSRSLSSHRIARPPGAPIPRSRFAAAKPICHGQVEADRARRSALAEEAARPKAPSIRSAYGDNRVDREIVYLAIPLRLREPSPPAGHQYLPAYHSVTPDSVWGITD